MIKSILKPTFSDNKSPGGQYKVFVFDTFQTGGCWHGRKCGNASGSSDIIHLISAE
jgi:hypothetical protein